MILILADNQDITRAGMFHIGRLSGRFSEIKEVRTKKELIGCLSEHPDAVTILDYTLFDISAYIQPYSKYKTNDRIY
ncbi:hypothetical protein EZS27_007220 [termite gut metagenome]|uniref:Uncharacterized protein n=1 Tax=termite gut metagenome TaxID=433724 RepID=A0A5J4SIU4_9ZZZZ